MLGSVGLGPRPQLTPRTDRHVRRGSETHPRFEFALWVYVGFMSASLCNKHQKAPGIWVGLGRLRGGLTVTVEFHKVLWQTNQASQTCCRTECEYGTLIVDRGF